VPATSTLLLILAAIAAVAAVAGMGILWWYRRTTGVAPVLAGGTKILASDTGAAPALMLRDPALGVCGKPDYVLDESIAGRRHLIPLELKPTRRGRRVYSSDAVQLGTYLLLLRSLDPDRAAPFGYVRYATGTFRVDLTDRLEWRVREIVAAIRSGRRAAVVHRSHTIRAKCAHCGLRPHCDEALV
jgi:hypothetical protein